MGNSITAAPSLAERTFTHQRSSTTITVGQQNGTMVHRLSARGVSAEYPIAYQVGSGILGRSFLVRLGDYFLQSPASWYSPNSWDVSPGLEPATMLDLERVVDENCLFCHAGRYAFSGEEGRRHRGSELTAITCERCHGSSAEHVRRPSPTNIVNPARLPARARDSVCEQCHLSGAARVLHREKSWRDFRPGDNFENTASVFLLNQSGSDVKVASQVEQLAESTCAKASGGKLWCGSCHDAHGEKPDRVKKIRDVCVSCHPSVHKTAEYQDKSECLSCHMPRTPAAGVMHVAITDHRILRRPAATATGALGTASQLPRVWKEPPTEFSKRDSGLAYVRLGFERGIPAMVEAGAKILEALPGFEQADDPAILAALAWVKLQKGMTEAGLVLCRRAGEKRPENAKYALNLGIAMTRSGDVPGAEQQLNRAIRLDPSLQESYLALAMLYDSLDRKRDMIAALDRYLSWNPQNIAVRLQKEALLKH